MRNTVASARGSSLIEALIATTIVVATLTGLAQLLLWARGTLWSAEVLTSGALLAAQKLEQLRGLTWELDVNGAAVADTETDLTTDPPSGGGSGLNPSPAGTLDGDTPGFFDYVDADGVPISPSARQSRTVFVRRWAIAPYGADPLHTLVLQVVAIPVRDAATHDGSRSRDAVRLTTIRTRSVR